MEWIFIYSALIFCGALLSTNLGETIANALGASEEKLSWMSNVRTRKLGAMQLMLLGGFIASIDLFWIQNKYMEYSGITAASTAMDIFGLNFDTTTFVGDLENNNFFGIPWGFGGMLFFIIVGWFTLSIKAEPTASWVDLFLKLGILSSGFGGIVSLYLVYIQTFVMDGVYSLEAAIIQLTIFSLLLAFTSLQRMKNEGIWVDNKLDSDPLYEKRKRRSSGYIAPTVDSEE
ncbi:MAG TPA: vitamin K epoxide reductase family protein [Candidatus Poseidoniales archaeon]|nr:MAG: hypothetical protein CXT69_01030 [Euryarchaeota archaeon]HIG03483.1 vitamin K epoxide reductase family protein [Candidatus Poseidoniales archaeon]HIK78957.1 vitamin K epoxide reductase family protein [Candidatus Poseidoniales archaeon]